MNPRREDPLLRQHRSRLLQLAEATNIKPGRGSGKRRGQRHGFGPSNGGPSRVTLQDIVRSDPGYTPNIEHLVFPERKSSNPNLVGVVDGSPPSKSKSNATSSGRSRLAEVFARHYARGSSQDSSVTSRKNHVNSTSLDSGSAIGHQPGSGGPTVVTRNAGRRWLSQNSQFSRQHSAEDGIRGGNVGVGGPVSTLSSSQAPGQAAPPALPPRRVSPAADTSEITNAGPISRVDRGPNVSILHLRNASADPWEVGSQGSSYSVGSNKSQTASGRGKSGGNARGSYSRGSSIPSLKRHDTSTSATPTSSLRQHRQDSHGQVSSSRRRDAVNSFLSGNSGTSGELFISGNCSRELSPVRWCDREVDGVYLGRSGWVQVQQRSLDENRRANYESNLVTATTGTLPLSRRTAVKLADYHCNSEPGKCPQDFTRGLDSQRPDFLALHSQDYDSITTSACTSPHSIPESFSPPSITPIISPPPAFQDAVAGRKSSSSRHSSSAAVRSNYGGKAPFLPRSNAIVDSDIISPPPSPPPHQVNWSSLPSASRKNSGLASSRSKRQNASQQQQQYRMAQAKSLEDQSSSRRSQFAQRYIESSSSSSSSMGFRSLDSCVTKPIMPSLAENTDSSVEGYEDGDEDDNPSSSLNLSLVSSSALALNSSTESIRANGERISPNRQGRIHRNQQGLRRSPGSSESGKQMFNSPSSSSSSSSSEGRQGRSPTPNPFRRNNPTRQHQSARVNQETPDCHESRVRRSRSLQLPEKRSPGTTGPQRDHSRESNEAHRVVVKIVNDRGSDRSKRHVLQNRKAQSTDDTINENLFRETEMVTEYLYGTRSRVVPRNLLSSRYESRRDESQEQRRGNSNTYDVYIISSKQQQQQQSKTSNSSQSQQQQQQQQQSQQQQQQSRRPRMLQRGATTPNTNAPSANQDFCISPDTKLRCNSSTCDFWPHCSQRETLYSPNQAPPPVFMKLSQSYPAHQRLSTDAGSHRGSASSSPASLERMDDRELRERDNARKSRSSQQGKYQERPKSVLKQGNRWSPLEGTNGNGSGAEKRDQMHHRVYRKPDFPGSFEGADSKDRRVSPIQGMNVVNRSPSGGPIVFSSTNTSSSSSSDIWITTSDRTVTKSPRNAKSSGASTPMEDAVIGSLKTLIEPPKDGTLSRPGSAPTRGEDSLTSDIVLDPHQRSLSLPKSFLAHNTADGRSTSWQRGQDSQRSSPSPSRLRRRAQEAAASHTAPVSPLHDYRTSGHAGRERRRIPGLSKAQRRIKASSTPALLDRNHDSRQWSGDEEDEGTRTDHATTEHPLAEATIPLVSHSRLQEPSSVLNVANVPTGGGQNAAHRAQSQQESVLQKFRKSFSLRFHKKGSKESNEECPAEDNDGSGPLDEEEGAETPSVTTSDQSSQHKDDSSNDQKFRFGPLVWRSSKERKKGNKAARNAKCNSGDSGIQIEMVSGGALTGGSGGGVMGGGDSSESHDTDDIPDDTDSPPALRRRVADKLRPQSELINQILIDKFKADLQNRSSRHNHVRRTNSDLGGQRLLQWDTRSGYVHNYRRMLSTPSPIKTRPPRLSPRHSSHDIVTLRSNAKGRSSRTNLRRSLSQPLGINQLSPLMRAKTAVGARLPGGNVLSEDEQDGRAGTSEDDEMMSDSESSITSLTDKKKSFEQTMDEEIVMLAEAVWDHVAMEPEELAFRAGDVIDVLDTLDRDWWWGSCRGEHGWFPAAFVRLRVSQEDTVEDCLAAMASGGSSGTQLRRRTSVSLLSNEQVRTSVVRELVQTERDFVKVLRDVAEGYIAECRRRTDMFTEEQIETIFINLEELLDFQSEFLKDLEDRIDWNAPYKSCIGECFLNHRAGFRMYSEYCNSHPMATATLQELYHHNRYSKFFEACRLMRGLIEIPLDGYLLTPIQRICKYPLQLAELLKYTKTDHPDYHKIQEALEAMRDVAVLINERKRRMESLEKLAAWQMRVEGWEGEDLIEVSSQLIYQGDAMRVKTGMWTNNITLFLFDHQLVYCKKDILKRDTYVYKGRIYLDTSEVIDVPDGKDLQSGVTVRHCLKVYSCVRDKWLLFCCRTAEEKRRWLAAMAEERRQVAQDRNDGLEFPAAARQLARLAANRQQNRPPIKPRNKAYKRESAYEMPTTMVGQGTTNSLGRKVGTWFMFGSSKKSTRLQPS
ncbi:rho guanine nucleotide exchange factor 3 isoform X4 [Temnothorax americanus]|uniref:rho guanine nucleotide exchange factor 3 isoform X4 n=1 Tax=Temnothorax americanus TaxID=1964332 RepID=UPI00406893A8